MKGLKRIRDLETEEIVDDLTIVGEEHADAKVLRRRSRKIRTLARIGRTTTDSVPIIMLAASYGIKKLGALQERTSPSFVDAMASMASMAMDGIRR
ncbi:MAG: hypothetical protein Q9219_007424 [cf. Caloplaca sp. 3 TL-2023]